MENPFIKIKEGDNDVLYVKHKSMVAAGISENSLKSAKLRRKKWAIDNPERKTENLYNYLDMPVAYQDSIKEWLLSKTEGSCSDPYIYTALQPIRESIVKDDKAEAFYLEYEYSLNGKITKLTPESIKEYTRNASLLNMLVAFKAKKKETKKRFGLDWLPFVEQVGKVIKSDGYSLPSSYRNLIADALVKYEAEGYKSIISARIGNQNRTKVKDLGKDLLLELLSHPNQYDDVFIKNAYNKWATAEGYETISSSTIKNKRVEYGYLIKGGREGQQEWNKEFNRRIHREAPTQPTYLWEGDDSHVDWWFVDDKNQIKRLKAYVVVDSYKGICYPLGWAVSENDITVETVRLAFLMAAHHIKELTGNFYLPHEVKTDRWSLSSLQTFYEGLGHYYPTPHRSKNRGWLENYFGHVDWKRSLKLDPNGYPSNNYTGNNISSKEMGFNEEALQLAYRNKELPHINESGKWISAHFERLRTVSIGWDEANPSRQVEWLNAWTNLDESKKRIITEEQFFLKLGLRHCINGGNEITKQGVQPTIAGASYSYAVPPAYYLSNIGRKVTTIYSPFDMNRVLITDNDNLRFIANHITPVAGCMADMQQGGRSLLNQILAEKTADVALVGAQKAARRDRLAAASLDAETVLKLGSSVKKELKTAAIEGYMTEKLITENNQSYKEQVFDYEDAEMDL